MKLQGTDVDRMVVSLAAMVARDRHAQGIRLSYPEAVAVIADDLVEGARSGFGGPTPGPWTPTNLTRADVLEGVPELLRSLSVEALFPGGTRQLAIVNPLG